MYKLLLATCVTLMLSSTGCFVSHTKEREVEAVPGATGRVCGDKVCDPDELCVASGSRLHCE
jgi:hypothetical protein